MTLGLHHLQDRTVSKTVHKLSLLLSRMSLLSCPETSSNMYRVAQPGGCCRRILTGVIQAKEALGS